jgi:SAM-dependent methyltransferase
MKNIQFDPQKIEIKFLNTLINFTDKKVLEIGCGNGEFSTNFKNVKSWTGIDIESEQIEIATKNTISQKHIFSCIDFMKYKQKNLFDLIIFRLSFHEINESEMEMTILRAKELLNKQGKILIIDPAFNGKFQEMYNIFYREIGLEHNNRLMKSREVLDKLLAEKQIRLENFYQFDSPVTIPGFTILKNFINSDYNFSDNIVTKLMKKISAMLNLSTSTRDFTVNDKLNIFILTKPQETKSA